MRLEPSSPLIPPRSCRGREGRAGDAGDGRREAGAQAHASLGAFRQAFDRINVSLRARHAAGAPATELVPARARDIDALLVAAWARSGLCTRTRICLVAVGGYGRGELHPFSDVDLLFLVDAALARGDEEGLERFIAFVWDVGLHIGHSVRSVEQCEADARGDPILATTLMDARLLAGPATLFDEMRERTGPGRMWSGPAFFDARCREQETRHHRFDDTASNLEPNVKDGPGALRDLHTVAWVARRHFGTRTLRELVDREFLTDPEHRALAEGRAFLWEVRLRLHLLSGRAEERLLFDHQKRLAALFGYRDDDLNLAVEKFMKRYYRCVTELSRLNEMLLALFRESILGAHAPREASPVNARFRAVDGYLEVTDSRVIARHPIALLELFLLLQQRPDLEGVRASTIRLVRDHRHLIDGAFRSDPEACALFREILRQPRRVARELRRMHRYGLLAEYLPELGAVSGQMQYDLFHAYTVDEHSLFVLAGLRSFAVPQKRSAFPLCSAVFEDLRSPELLYVAGLFHDIGKGQGGDHSELGAHAALAFCHRHGFDGYDSRFVAWLVRHHLLMSHTAQRQDISDPQVVNRFARAVGDRMHLDYLYLLTVADIRATNPNLWSDWKDALLRDLYFATRRALRRGLENPIDRGALIAQSETMTRELLGLEGERAAAALSLWRSLGTDYFLRYAPEEICWHTRAILDAAAEDLPLVLLRQGRGGTEIFAYAADRKHLFAASTAALDRQGLGILDSRILTAENAMTLDTYVVSERSGGPIRDRSRQEEVRRALRAALREPRAPRAPARHRVGRRRLRHFDIPTEVRFHPDDDKGRSLVEVVTADRPGLLVCIGIAFAECGVRLQNAKIATYGERAEDVFFVTERGNRPLGPETKERVRQRLLAAVSTPPEAGGAPGAPGARADRGEGGRAEAGGAAARRPRCEGGEGDGAAQPPVTGGKKATSSPSATGWSRST